jgi:hypothetical protein
VKIDFHQGAYEARGLSAAAEQQINLYAEPDPPGSPYKTSLYHTPGIVLLQDYSGIGVTGHVRGLYRASNRALYVCIGVSLFHVIGGFNLNFLTGFPTDSGNPVVMCDNGTTLVAVDGTSYGIAVTLTTNTATHITDPNFYGANRVDYIDTFFVFNRPFTEQWYISNSNDITFNALYFANKTGYNDLVISIAVLHDTIWVLGDVTTELWYNTGTADFPFSRMPQAILQQGCVAPYSVVVSDNAVYWLSQDRHGRNMLMRGEGYTAKRVSNFAVESAWSKYGYVGNTVGMSYTEAGHQMIIMQFLNDGFTWVYDATTGFWHQRAYGQPGTGGYQAWLGSCIAYWNAGGGVTNNYIVVGDRISPRLYQMAQSIWDDNGQPTWRIRNFPHIQNDQKRLAHNQFVAAMPGGLLAPDQVSLSWSDDMGHSYSTPVVQTANSAYNGQYSWRRLGMSRNRIYQLSWTAHGEASLNGAWLEATPADT